MHVTGSPMNRIRCAGRRQPQRAGQGTPPAALSGTPSAHLPVRTAAPATTRPAGDTQPGGLTASRSFFADWLGLPQRTVPPLPGQSAERGR